MHNGILGLQPLGATGLRLETGAKVDPAVGLVLTGVRGGQSFMDQVAKLLPPLRPTTSKTNCSSRFCETRKAEVEWDNFWVNIRATETLK